MHKSVKIGGGVLAVLAVVAIAGTALLVSNLDGLVKTAIEKVGTEVAGSKVSVGEVKITLGEGIATISNLSVANPAGFKEPTAFSLGQVSVTLDAGTVTGNPVVIKTISVVEPAITYEMGDKGSNIDALQRHVQSKTGGGKSGPAKAQPAGDDEKKLVIDRLTVTNGTVTLASPLPGVKGSAKLGDIVMTGIGRDGGGASAAEVAGRFLNALTGSALKAATSMGIGDVGEAVKSVVPGDAGGALKGIFGK